MKTAFDLKRELTEALARLWAKKDEVVAAGRGWRGHETYTTAQELEREVRDDLVRRAPPIDYDRRAVFTEAGDPVAAPKNRRRFSGVMRISTGRPGGLLQAARGFLLGEARAGRLELEDFGRGHVSGARFRRPGTEPGAGEVETLKRKAKPRAVHYRDPATEGSYSGAAPLCSAALRATLKKKRTWWSGRGRRRSWPTDDMSRVTCPRCLKLAGAEKNEEARG